MHFYYSAEFDLILSEGHRFPGNKYGLLKENLLTASILNPAQLHISEPADDAALLLAHTLEYVSSLESGSIDRAAMRRIGFPWSPQIPLRGRKTVGGAIAAARSALKYGLSGQLAGGTHHAHAGFGSGYCIFNDFAVVVRTLLEQGLCERIAIIDLDVHQGDGTAAILLQDGQCPSNQVIILDIYGAKNFPFRKTPATFNISLPDNPGDEIYLATLERALPDIWAFQPDLVLYQAGVDSLLQDSLGRMDISFEGLMRRDELVLKGCWQRGIPVSMAIGGGYAKPIAPTVQAYTNTYRVAKQIFKF